MPDFDSAFFLKLPFMWRMLFLLLIFSSCSNRFVDGKKHGYWKERDTIENSVYKGKGRYSNDSNKGTWRYYKDNKCYKKEIYKGDSCQVFLFDEKGKLIRSGYTKMEVRKDVIHWFYEGNWINYDTNEQPESYDIYVKGEQVGETKPYAISNS